MSDAREIVDAALAASSADDYVVIAEDETVTNLRWAANALTTNGTADARTVTVVSIFERRGGASAGVVTRSVNGVDEVDDLVRAAEAAGREAEPADDACPLVAAEPSDATGWDVDEPDTDPDVFGAFAGSLGPVLRRWRDGGPLLYGYAQHSATTYYLATSTGVRRHHRQVDGELTINAKARTAPSAGPTAPTASTWAGHYTRDFAAVDVDALAESAQRRLEWADRRVDLPPGRYETLLPPSTVADLMISAYFAASGRDADEGRSAFAAPGGGTRVGEQLANLPVTLRSDPAADGLSCAPFVIASSSDGDTSVFDNGLELPATSWLADGTLADLVRTRAWARRAGAPARPYIDNLIMELPGASASLEDMVANTERGLLLTSLWYIRTVDPQTLLLTGLTRDGVYLIEDGEVQGAVNNFRFNSSPLDLLARAVEIGRTEPTLSREWGEYLPRTAMPPIRVPDFNMSSVSPAS